MMTFGEKHAAKLAIFAFTLMVVGEPLVEWVLP